MVDLVEFIQKKANLNMMADVKNHITEEHLKEWYSELNPSDYTVFQWNDALAYIKHDIKKFNTIEEVDNWLKSK